MKTPYFLIFFFLLTSSSLAQIKEGSWLAGGSVDFSRNGLDEGNYKTISFSFSPTALFLLTDQFALGASVPFSYTGTIDQDPKTSNMSFAIGPVARYYFPLNEKTYFFPELRYSLGAAKTKSYMFDAGVGGVVPVEYTSNINNFSAGAGMAYFIAPNVAIEGFFGYSSYKSKNNDSDSEYKFASIGINFGFQIYLGRGSE